MNLSEVLKKNEGTMYSNYYAMTINCLNRRDDIQLDADRIKSMLTSICDTGSVSHCGWELQPNGNHNLHVHFLYNANSFYINNHLELMKKLQLNIDCQILFTAKDIQNWVRYCRKSKPPTINEYMETYVDKRGSLFDMGSHGSPTIADINYYEDWLKDIKYN